MREPWVCTRSQGQRARNVATSSSSRSISRADVAGAGRAGNVERGQVIGLAACGPDPTNPPGRPARRRGRGGAEHHLGRVEVVVEGRRTALSPTAGPATSIAPPGTDPGRSRSRRANCSASTRRTPAPERVDPEPLPGQVQEREARERRSGPPWGRRAAARRFARPPAASPAPHRRSAREPARSPPRPAPPQWRRRPRRTSRPTRTGDRAPRYPERASAAGWRAVRRNVVPPPAIERPHLVGQVRRPGGTQAHHRDVGTVPPHRLGGLPGCADVRLATCRPFTDGFSRSVGAGERGGRIAHWRVHCP